MSILTIVPFLRTKTPRQVISESWNDRQVILASNTNLFCWNRKIDTRISNYLKQLLEQKLNPICFRASAEEISDNLKSAKSKWGYDTSEACNLFWNDVHQLIVDFLSLTNKESVNVHLKVIDNDACTKFHTDGYPLRLFTTYVGQGTEWLPEKASNRAALGTSNDRIVKDVDQIQRMREGDVGILKGELPNRRLVTKGIIHRSPKISQVGEKRIILRIDV